MTQHTTHLLKLVDMMCKYKMDLASIVEDTERTCFCPQTDRRSGGQTDKVTPVYPSSTSYRKHGFQRIKHYQMQLNPVPFYSP